MRNFQQRTRELVGLLRERGPDGIRGAFSTLLAERNRALANDLSSKGATILEGYDRLMLTALSMRYDALDRAVHETSFAVAEIDGEGLISYANEALQKMLPGAVGHDFASLFGPRSLDVSDALSAQKRETLRLDLHRGNLPSDSVHLRGEIGPLSDEYNRSGAYALLLGVEGEEARFDALPDGILRLDPDGNVVFANRRANEIFSAGSEQLRGRAAISLFRSSEAVGGPPPVADWLKSADSHRELAEARPLSGGCGIPVRITVTPSFDTTESRAGVVLTVVPIDKELAQADLQHLLGIPECEPERLVRGVMRAVRRIVPYDLATFGIYTDDMKYHLTLVVHPQPKWTWTTAWFPLDPEVRDFLLGERTWGDDLQATAKAVNPSIDDDDVLRRVINDGMRGFITLPISGGGRRVRASMTLLSKEADCYNGREIAEMRDLGIEKALLVAEANIVRRREGRVRAFEANLAGASGYRDIAKALACGIADCFGWDYVAVFGIDRRESLFRLINQCNRTGSPDVDREYRQPLTEGLLGTALRDNETRVEPNIEAGSKYGYKAVIPGRRSALAAPVRVLRQGKEPTSDEIDWLISIESSQRNAFQGPEMVSLRDILAQCEIILRQRWQNAVQGSLLSAVGQAVIVVDQAGKVRLTNEWANTLLGHEGGFLLGEVLANLGAQEVDRRMLRSNDALAQVRLTLCANEHVVVPTLATQRQICDDYGHRLWLFTDLREQEHQSSWSYLEETVNEVAQNARVPLVLAGNLVRNAAKCISQGSAAAKMLDSAARQLSKADITYERLVTTLAVHQEPDRPPQIFDVTDVLRQVVADLPAEDQEHCDFAEFGNGKSATLFLISGWPEQLGFAFRSLLGYLLLQRPFESRVRIASEKTINDRLNLRFSVPTGGMSEWTGSTGPTDRISVAEQRAREVTSLASDAVMVAVRRHNGEFLIDTHDRSMLAFRIDLRSTPLESLGKEA
jgi:PAS domain-containing protein